MQDLSYLDDTDAREAVLRIAEEAAQRIKPREAPAARNIAEVYLGESKRLEKPAWFTIIPVAAQTSQDKGWVREHKTGKPATELPTTVTVLPGITVTRTE